LSQPALKKVQGEDVKIALTVWKGKGKAVLCIHGIAGNCRTWDTIANVLVPDYFVLAMDLRGRGLSDKPASGYSIMHHCKDITELLNDQDINRVSIIGHSLGAFIGLYFAACYPERMDRLILVDGGGKLTKRQTDKIFAGIQPTLDRLGRVFPSKQQYMDLMKANPLLKPWTPALETYYSYELEETRGGVRSRVNPEHIREEAANLSKFNVEEFYSKIKCPVLILRATEGMQSKDAILLPDNALKRMLKEIPNVQHVNLFQTNHYSIVLQPNMKRDHAILSFLET